MIMKAEPLYKPHKLSSALMDISRGFYLPEEFPTRRPSERAERLLARLTSMRESDLDAFYPTVSGADLDSLLLLIPNASAEQLIGILRILRRRANRRVLRLFWPFFQFNYKNPNVTNAAETILHALPPKDRETQIAENLSLFLEGRGFEALLERLKNNVVPLGTFTAREGLVRESPLAQRFCELYFTVCGKEGFLLNPKRFMLLIDKASNDVSDAMLINYLRSFDREEFLEDVNMSIIYCRGEPFGSDDWSDIPQELRRKFADWNSYRLLAGHFTRNKRKLRVLADLIPHIIRIRLAGKNTYLAADFGDFVIVDVNELSSYSYLIKKSLYERLSKKIEESGIESVLYSMDRVVNARDFIIEEAEDSFMQLEYDELGKLYIKDMINIMLGLTPDLRPSKSLINKKRRGGRG